MFGHMAHLTFKHNVSRLGASTRLNRRSACSSDASVTVRGKSWQRYCTARRVGFRLLKASRTRGSCAAHGSWIIAAQVHGHTKSRCEVDVTPPQRKQLTTLRPLRLRYDRCAMLDRREGFDVLRGSGGVKSAHLSALEARGVDKGAWVLDNNALLVCLAECDDERHPNVMHSARSDRAGPVTFRRRLPGALGVVRCDGDRSQRRSHPRTGTMNRRVYASYW